MKVHCMDIYMHDWVMVYVHTNLLLEYCFNMVLQWITADGNP